MKIHLSAHIIEDKKIMRYDGGNVFYNACNLLEISWIL